MQKLAGIEALFTLVDIYIITKGVFSCKLRKGAPLVILLTSFFVCGTYSYFYPATELSQFVAVLISLLCIIMPICLIRNTRYRDIAFIAVMISGIVTGIVMMMVRIVEISGFSGIALPTFNIIAHGLALGLCILTAKRVLLKHIMHSILLISNKIKFLLAATVWIGVTLTYALSLFVEIVPFSPSVVLVALLSLILVAISGIICPLLVADNISKNNYKAALASTQTQMRNQVKYYEAVIANDKEVRKFKHDYKNLYIGLRTYLSSNDNIGALQYLTQLNRPLENDYLSYNSGDFILDALLADKQVLAANTNTAIEYDGMLPNRLLAPEDVCLIFGNAVDNALEACAKLPTDESKIIRISCVYSTGFLFIKISNPVLSDVEIYRNSIKSTKTDGGFHGIGLLSIQNAISNYSGIMSLRCADNIFSFEVDLDFNEMAMSS